VHIFISLRITDTLGSDNGEYIYVQD